MKRFSKHSNPFLEFTRHHQMVPVSKNSEPASNVSINSSKKNEGGSQPSVSSSRQTSSGGEPIVVKYIRRSSVDKVIVTTEFKREVTGQPPTHRLNPVFTAIIKQLREEIRKQKDMGNPGFFTLPQEELPPPLVGGAAVAAAEAPLQHLADGGLSPEAQTFQVGKNALQPSVESSLVSSLGLLLNKAFSLSGPALTNLMQTLVNNHLQLQSAAQGLASAETLFQQAPLQAKAGDFPPSTIKGFVESVAHQVSLALSMTVSHGAELNPAQALTLALAKSLNLSAEQTAKLLGQIQSATAGQLSAATGEQARLVNPFIQGMVLNDPSAMKGFMAQLFSPVLKSLMGLLFTKELPFSYFPSNLLTELGGLMARSAQRKRNRPQRKRIGKSDRVSRKGSIYVEVDLEDEGFEPEEETDWWERFYNPEEAHAFLWN